LLKGSELIKLNFKDPDNRSLFTSATKIVTIIVIVAEGSLYGVSVYGHLLASPSFIPILVAQLVGSSLIVMYLDETIQKGWGLGSGISLFIMAGVAQGIMWSIFSPIPAQDGPVGVIPYIIHSAAQGDMSNVLFRTGQLPSIFGLIVTSLVLLALVYVQGIHVDIPIVSTKYRGFTAVYPIKLLYTSNIPVILASALLANAVFIGQMLWANYNPENANPVFNYIAQFDPQSSQSPTGGILYYITAPRTFEHALQDPLRTVVYVIFWTGIVTVFGRLWVELGGLSPKSAAKNLLDADVQVPGFRRTQSSVQTLLNKYIPAVTIAGGIIIGLLAAVSNVLSVFGTGIGILLMVDILVNYYNLLIREQVDVHMPKLASLLGRT
jgi:preprotein translocase subunit SecY